MFWEDYLHFIVYIANFGVALTFDDRLLRFSLKRIKMRCLFHWEWEVFWLSVSLHKSVCLSPQPHPHPCLSVPHPYPSLSALVCVCGVGGWREQLCLACCLLLPIYPFWAGLQRACVTQFFCEKQIERWEIKLGSYTHARTHTHLSSRIDTQTSRYTHSPIQIHIGIHSHLPRYTQRKKPHHTVAKLGGRG